eukprot:TRINITY_DN5986_c0_g2_i4.p1 TRINITY_DN5986_c0_g2~~TRINITY_DN5986_c0_g2_i4.p1  ORF type:complete len:316 (-),score=4.85 TRINITY_DN5986_c0_g2_i4:248-1195(-)
MIQFLRWFCTIQLYHPTNHKTHQKCIIDQIISCYYILFLQYYTCIKLLFQAILYLYQTIILGKYQTTTTLGQDIFQIPIFQQRERNLILKYQCRWQLAQYFQHLIQFIIVCMYLLLCMQVIIRVVCKIFSHLNTTFSQSLYSFAPPDEPTAPQDPAPPPQDPTPTRQPRATPPVQPAPAPAPPVQTPTSTPELSLFQQLRDNLLAQVSTFSPTGSLDAILTCECPTDGANCGSECINLCDALVVYLGLQVDTSGEVIVVDSFSNDGLQQSIAAENALCDCFLREKKGKCDDRICLLEQAYTAQVGILLPQCPLKG